VVDVTPGQKLFSVSYDPGQITTARMLEALAQARENATLAAGAAQDVEYLESLDRVQLERPRELSATARIAPESEPGTPLVVHGRLFEEDGRTPVAGAVVFGYHTDREGRYDQPGRPAHSWRLRGWCRTDPHGRFRFDTIRPGAYPSRREPAHVHLTAFTASGRYHAGALLFDDDPLVPAAVREESTRAGAFGEVRPIRRVPPTEHVDASIRLDPARRF
jgi:protocatechuate 3,4-dioxygenase beta subunit